MNTRIMNGHARENIYYIRACVIKHVLYIHTYVILKLLFHYDTGNKQTTNRELARARLTAERFT